MKYTVKRDHYTTGAAYKDGDTREMDEADAAPLVTMGVLEAADGQKAKAQAAAKADAAK